MKCISILLVLLPTLCFAQPNTRIPVEVDIVSVTDRIGDLLAYEVKEGIRRSSTMRLTYDVEPRIRIILHTMAEYGEDSHLACALAVVWVLDRPDDMNIFLGCNLCENTARLIGLSFWVLIGFSCSKLLKIDRHKSKAYADHVIFNVLPTKLRVGRFFKYA